MKPCVKLGVAGAVLAMSWASHAVELVTWDKTPIPLTLEIGVERIVDFGVPVKVGVPSGLQPLLRTQSSGGVVYWLAHDGFEMRRVQVQNAETGDVVLFDLKAVAPGEVPNNERIKIVSPDPTFEDAEALAADEIGPIDLIRVAAKAFYAPKRLATEQQGIRRVPMRLPESMPRLFTGSLTGKLNAKPLAAWRAGRLYVTAVKLTNTTPQTLTLDHRLLMGSLTYATFQHADVGPRGTATDTTTVYLITEGEPEARLAL